MIFVKQYIQVLAESLKDCTILFQNTNNWHLCIFLYLKTFVIVVVMIVYPRLYMIVFLNLW